ncbi:heavy metal translocatin, partial [Coniochaeta sp. PMI_546]
CNMHLQTAFAKYSAYLETAKCICRSVLDRGLRPACCTSREDIARPRQLSRDTASREGKSSRTNTCTAEQSLKPNCCQTSAKPVQLSPSTCGSSASCGPEDKSRPLYPSSSATCCPSDSCAPKIASEGLPLPSTRSVTSAGRDLEKNSELEHVSLAVQGMTCSGCATKFARVVNDIVPNAVNFRVDFVMGSAEFDLATPATSIPDTVQAIEKASGFQCTVLNKLDQYLDLLVSPRTSLAALQNVSLPGVLQVSPLTKRVVRVVYDPTVVGARALLERLGNLTDGLAPPPEDPSLANSRKKMHDMLLKTLASWILTIPVLVLAWGQLPLNPNTRASIQFSLATLVQLIAIPEFYQPAVSALLYSGVVEMDMLIVISITAAYLYSVVAFGFRLAGSPLETAEFFETSTLLITLVVFSRLVAAYARIRAVSAVSMRSLQPTTAVLIEGGAEREVDARLLQFGDRFKVFGDCKIATDGRVIEGVSEVDESMITGENTPVVKRAGMDVIAGARNIWGTMIVQATRLPGHNTVTDIADMVERASKGVPKMQTLADRVASYFVPTVSGIAIVVLIVWIIIYTKARDNTGGQAVAHAITYAIAVLAISCPCGIGLAVPMVLVIAGGIAARAGVIIKSADSTERARKVTDVLFDKTGTLTEAELDVASLDLVGSDKGEAAEIIQTLVQGNKHPVSVAIAKYMGQTQTTLTSNLRVIPGAGVEGTYAGVTIRGGSPQWTGTFDHPLVTRLTQDKMTVFCVTKDTRLVAVAGLRTHIREEAVSVVAQLQRRGIAVHLVSGDNSGAVGRVASKLGIPLSFVAANCTPGMKRDYVANLKAEEKSKTVMFCGDGTNDAVAVMQADVGVQISGGNELATRGSEVTRGAADVVLLAGLQGIPFLIDLSRAAYHRMVFNFVWSGLYNLLAILMTAGAFVTFRIPPAYAGLGEVVSILPVILAAVTLLAVKIRA